MNWLIALAMLIFGLYASNDVVLVTSGLYMIASSIDCFTRKFNKKDE